MKATLEWIREFVDFDMDPEELADRLTNIGLECTVDLDGVLDGVVVGQIVEVLPHPRADHLKVCKVAAGSEVLTVICGAPNTEVATRAPLALVGARLPGGLEIGASEIRGVRSEGMLCSEAELEVGDDAAGIWILPDELPLGAPLDQVLKLRDWVLEFDLTPNRSDCLSILGLAYEVAAITGSKANVPEISLHEEGSSIHDRFNVTIRDPELCPRYVARILDGTKVQQSPLWLRRRLQLVGLRPINNLVDVTNYVMWELGQPLHVFDLDLLEGTSSNGRAAGILWSLLTERLDPSRMKCS
jgi:phenylalanyl-tRNA synthetase beta chain